MTSLPVVVYTGRDLTKDERALLEEYAESTIIKGVRSQERLLDEVTLFLKKIESGLPVEQRQKPRMLHNKDAVLHDKTILVVDDDLRNVYALANVLDDKGLHVLVAEDGENALEQLEKYASQIDLVLMDIMMPGMDGYEAMRRIRQQARFKKLPIIALTAKAMKGDRQKCLEAGANDYLSKPLDIDKLFSLLRVWLY
jgi:CheY-like chemotaxis protein